MIIEAPRFATIREVAKMGIISEHYLRLGVKSGTVPGVYSGSKFLVNVDMLIEQLNEQSKRGGAGQ